MNWDERADIIEAFENMRNIFQSSLEEIGYDYENDPRNLQIKWANGVMQVQGALNDMERDFFFEASKEFQRMQNNS